MSETRWEQITREQFVAERPKIRCVASEREFSTYVHADTGERFVADYKPGRPLNEATYRKAAPIVPFAPLTGYRLEVVNGVHAGGVGEVVRDFGGEQYQVRIDGGGPAVLVSGDEVRFFSEHDEK